MSYIRGFSAYRKPPGKWWNRRRDLQLYRPARNRAENAICPERGPSPEPGGTVHRFKVNFNIQAEHGSSTQFDSVLDVQGVSIGGPDPATVVLKIGHNSGFPIARGLVWPRVT